MKPLLFVFLTYYLATTGYARLNEAAFTVRVVDEAGSPVSNATISAGFWKDAPWGSGPGHVVNDHARAHSDSNGVALFKGRTGVNGGKVGKVVWGITKDGYYSIEGMVCSFTNHENGRLLPWNAIYEVTLHKVLNPIPMYARSTALSWPMVTIPIIGQPCGFDLMISDWTAPHGKGDTADFIFRLDVKPSNMPPGYYDRYLGAVSNSDMVFTLSFSNPGDGIQECLAPRYKGSRLRLPRYAPDSGYCTSITSRYTATLGSVSNDMDRPDMNYFFRIRSHSDPSGAVTSALFGKIYGPFIYDYRGPIQIQYYLNPTPNDRNMEYAGTDHNLLKVPLDIENPPWP